MRKGLLICLIALLLLVTGCNSGNSVPTGSLTVTLSEDSARILGNGQLTVQVIRDGSNETMHSITLSSSQRSQTVSVPPGMYRPVSGNKAFLIAPERITVNAGTSQEVTVIPNEKGTVNIRLSDSAVAALANSEYTSNVAVYLHKDSLESIPVYKDWIYDSSVKTVEVGVGKYQLAYTTNSDALFVTPGEVTVNPGDVVDMVIDRKAFGILDFSNISNVDDYHLNVYSDSERRNLIYRINKNSTHKKIAVEPGTYYLEFLPKQIGRYELLEDIATVSDGNSFSVSAKETEGRIDVSIITKDFRDEYESIDIPYVLDFTDSTGTLKYSVNVGYSGEVFLPEDTYSVAVRYPSDDCSYRILIPDGNLTVEKDMYGNPRMTYNTTVQQTGKILFAGKGISENPVSIEMTEITDSEVPVSSEFRTDNVPEFIPSGKYHVSATLVDEKANTSLSRSEFDVNIQTGKEETVSLDVYMNGILSINLTEAAKTAIGPNDVIVELSDADGGKLSYTVTSSGENKFVVPEGNYSYKLKYENSAMSITPENGDVSVTYNNNTTLNFDGSSKTSITVVVKDSIIGDSEITVEKNGNILSVVNSPALLTYKWVWYDFTSKEFSTANGASFDTSKGSVDRESVQLRVYSGERLIDVIQAGYLFRESN